MTVYSRSYWQNGNNWRFWIRKNKSIAYNKRTSDSLIDKIYLYAKDLSELKYKFEWLKIIDLNDSKWFTRCRKLNISLVFTTESYSSVPKEGRLNSTHYLIIKIRSKGELQNITANHSAQQTLIINILWKFIGRVQVNHILFWLLMLHYLLTILQEKIF